MPHCDTLLNAAIIITQNPDRHILENSSLAIMAGKIAAIGPTAQMRQTWSAEKILDLNNAMVMPGLINAHTHAAMTFLRGLADDLPLMQWLEKNIFPVEARLTHEIVRIGSLLGYAEMLASGTTACMDMYIFEKAVFEAAELAGVRCTGGEAVFCFPSAACKSWRDALAITREMAAHYAANERICIAVNPHSVYTTTPEILGACRNLALEINSPVHIHLGETREETRRCMAEHGKKPVEYCLDMGLFQNRVVAAHLVDITADEAYLLAQKSACGVHNPSSNMKLASGAAPICEMMAQGLPMALGSDGPASNNTLNMFSEMNRAALLHKLMEKDPSALPAPAALDMATLGGAVAIGNPSLGSLEPGKSADCIALDLTRPNLQPMHNPISQTVYAASGHECILTMVGGEVLYKNGEFTRFDYGDILEQAKDLRNFVTGKKKN